MLNKNKIISLVLGLSLAAIPLQSNAVSNIKYGDVNRDGKVNTKDAECILEYAVKDTNITSDVMLGILSDINADGKVSVEDARKTLRIAKGYEKKDKLIVNSEYNTLDKDTAKVIRKRIRSEGIRNKNLYLFNNSLFGFSDVIPSCNTSVITNKKGKSDLVVIDNLKTDDSEAIIYYCIYGKLNKFLGKKKPGLKEEDNVYCLIDDGKINIIASGIYNAKKSEFEFDSFYSYKKNKKLKLEKKDKEKYAQMCLTVCAQSQLNYNIKAVLNFEDIFI